MANDFNQYRNQNDELTYGALKQIADDAKNNRVPLPTEINHLKTVEREIVSRIYWGTKDQ